jgi:hypothetical protein
MKWAVVPFISATSCVALGIRLTLVPSSDPLGLERLPETIQRTVVQRPPDFTRHWVFHGVFSFISQVRGAKRLRSVAAYDYMFG